MLWEFIDIRMPRFMVKAIWPDFILRRRALDLARRDTSRGSLSIKLQRAGWSDAFLLSLPNQLAKV